MVEESEDVSDRISVCNQYLQRDEEGTVEGILREVATDWWKMRSSLVENTVIWSRC